MTDEEETFMPPRLMEKRRLNPSSAFMYVNSNVRSSGDEDSTEFVGPYFTMVNPLHLVGNPDADHNDHLALVVDGASRLHGDLTVLNAEGDAGVFHVSSTKASVKGAHCLRANLVIVGNGLLNYVILFSLRTIHHLYMLIQCRCTHPPWRSKVRKERGKGRRSYSFQNGSI